MFASRYTQDRGEATTVQEQLRILRQAAADALDSIKRLENIAVAHDARLDLLTASAVDYDRMIKNHDLIIEKLDRQQELTAAAVRSAMDELQDLRRQWQAYINRLPRQ